MEQDEGLKERFDARYGPNRERPEFEEVA